MKRERESNLDVSTISDFEIIAKAPNRLYDELNKKMDFLINKINGIL